VAAFMALEVLSLWSFDWIVMVKLFHAFLAWQSFFAMLERDIDGLVVIVVYVTMNVIFFE